MHTDCCNPCVHVQGLDYYREIGRYCILTNWLFDSTELVALCFILMISYEVNCRGIAGCYQNAEYLTLLAVLSSKNIMYKE